MRTISRTSRFKKDYKREAKGKHRATLDAGLMAAISLLAEDGPLPENSTITLWLESGETIATATSSPILC